MRELIHPCLADVLRGLFLAACIFTLSVAAPSPASPSGTPVGATQQTETSLPDAPGVASETGYFEALGKRLRSLIASPSVSIVEMLLIGALVLEWIKRRQAEQARDERVRFETLISELSASFINLAPGSVSKEIQRGLQRVLGFLRVDRAALVEFSEDTGEFVVTHSWSAAGVETVLSVIDCKQFPEVTRRLQRGEIVRFSRPEQLSAQADTDRRTFQTLGVKSHVSVPLVVGGATLGLLFLSTVREERDWPDELVQRLRLLAEVFANALMRERTETKAQQHRQALAHFARVATMGELAASIAHELNQPLTAIMSNAQAAQRFLAAPKPRLEEVREILADIVNDDKRAGEVVRRLRAMVTKGQVEFTRVRLNDLIHEAVRLVHAEAALKHVAISLELDPALPAVRGDRIQLQQVLLNLIMNALEAMQAVEAKSRQIVVRTSRNGAQRVNVAVRDRGTGIASEKADRIFEPFFTTKPEGMGMGLSISRSIVTKHGGRLWGENNADGGATFQFSLPSTEEAAA